jgi:hypothetical protein
VRVFWQRDQQPPERTPVTEGVVTRLEHVYEVDPKLMNAHFKQQEMPVWDSERIVDSRWEHLKWMHFHFADEVLSAGEEPELDDAPTADPGNMER